MNIEEDGNRLPKLPSGKDNNLLPVEEKDNVLPVEENDDLLPVIASDLSSYYVFGTSVGAENTYGMLDKPITPNKFVELYQDDSEDRKCPSFSEGFLFDKKKGKKKTSGSSWSIGALLAFRVVPVRQLEPSRVIPGYDAVEQYDTSLRDQMLKAFVEAQADDLGLVTLDTLAKSSAMPHHQGLIKKRDRALVRKNKKNPPLEDDKAKSTTLEAKRKNKKNPLLEDDNAKSTTVDTRPISGFHGNPFLTAFTAIRDLRSRMLAEQYEADYDFSAKLSTEQDENKNEQGSEELLHRIMDVILMYFSELNKGYDWLRR